MGVAQSLEHFLLEDLELSGPPVLLLELALLAVQVLLSGHPVLLELVDEELLLLNFGGLLQDLLFEAFLLSASQVGLVFPGCFLLN